MGYFVLHENSCCGALAHLPLQDKRHFGTQFKCGTSYCHSRNFLIGVCYFKVMLTNRIDIAGRDCRLLLAIT